MFLVLLLAAMFSLRDTQSVPLKPEEALTAQSLLLLHNKSLRQPNFTKHDYPRLITRTKTLDDFRKVNPSHY